MSTVVGCDKEMLKYMYSGAVQYYNHYTFILLGNIGMHREKL